MPAIQAMRSDALALRAKEDVQEKIPSFFNQVSQALGQSVVAGQDAAEQLIQSRFTAANQLVGQLRQKLDSQGGLAELAAGAGMKVISQILSSVLSIMKKTTTTDAIQVASDILNFMTERQSLQLQWDAAAATYAQWVVQAGYAGHGNNGLFTSQQMNAMGGRGAIKYRDALTPRFTDRKGYLNATASLGAAPGGLAFAYDYYYAWGSVGSITRIGQYS